MEVRRLPRPGAAGPGRMAGPMRAAVLDAQPDRRVPEVRRSPIADVEQGPNTPYLPMKVEWLWMTKEVSSDPGAWYEISFVE